MKSGNIGSHHKMSARNRGSFKLGTVLLFWISVQVIDVQGREHLKGLCPYRCHCRRLVVNCTNADINRPLSLPINTRTLILDGNRIDQLTSTYFRGLKNLQVLSIKSNNLSSIDPTSFQGLPSLQQVYCGDNHLTSLHPDTFKETRQLTLLSLAGNALTLTAINDSLQYLGNLEKFFLHR